MDSPDWDKLMEQGAAPARPGPARCRRRRCRCRWTTRSPDAGHVNPNGSGISLGHPVGATGARILATMLRELDRREGRYALETMCIGGGQGLAAVFERVA